VKQKNRAFTPAQIKSALVNTASQDVQDAGATASVRAVGAGKLNAGAAVNTTTTVSPATISFGAIASTTVSISRTLTIVNAGAASVQYALAVEQRTPSSSAQVQLGSNSVTVGAGGQNNVTVTLAGSRPAPGSYEGFITVTGGGQTLRVPYLYLVGDNIPADVYVIRNGVFVDAPGGAGWGIGLRAVDAYGVPVTNLPIQFQVVSGGGRITSGDAATDRLGDGGVFVDLGPQLGEQVFRGRVGGPQGPSVDFFGIARPYPAIRAGGIVNAATNQAGVAAGSYVSIYGTDLSDALQIEQTPSLPVTLSTVAVTFDSEGISQPGKLHFVSPTQVNAQIPGEFQGKSSVKVKIWMGALPSNVITVPLSQYAPGFFEVAGLAAAQDINYALINRSHPARRGEVVQLYLNGLGPVTNQPASGEPTGSSTFSTTLVAPSVTVGGRPAQVIFSGLTPGVVGLYQVNAILAADTPTGDQQVTVSIDGVPSKPSVQPVQ
jgi:uncharacterized protein (TIGR03437 family)